MSGLRGGAEFRARLKAIQQSFKPLGREWADKTVPIAKRLVPVASGRTQKSIRRQNASLRKASVVAGAAASYIELGYPPHTIEAKEGSLSFKAGGAVRFAKRVTHPAARGKPFLRPAAQQAFKEMDGLGHVIKAWNNAGGNGGGLRVR